MKFTVRKSDNGWTAYSKGKWFVVGHTLAELMEAAEDAMTQSASSPGEDSSDDDQVNSLTDAVRMAGLTPLAIDLTKLNMFDTIVIEPGDYGAASSVALRQRVYAAAKNINDFIAVHSTGDQMFNFRTSIQADEKLVVTLVPFEE